MLSGVIFFGMYAPEGMSPFAYSVMYNGSYIFAEGLILVLIFPYRLKRWGILKRNS